MEITKEDVLEYEPNGINKMILAAVREAYAEDIKANSIIINKKFVKVPSHWANIMGSYSELPPMICGLECYFTNDELPEDYSFAVLEAHHTERERLIADTTDVVARSILAKAIELSDTSETMYEFQNRLIDFVEQNYSVQVETDTIIGEDV